MNVWFMAKILIFTDYASFFFKIGQNLNIFSRLFSVIS